jgi:CRP/FNR family transcriptional regulator, cyclic AMP receptor protein
MRTEFIRRVPLFAGLSDEEFREIERAFQPKAYRKNQVIFVEEQTGEYMYVVLAGKVRVTKSGAGGKETILAIHQVGDFFGEMSLLDGKTTPATVSAMEDCKIVTISKADFYRHLMRNEKVVAQIIQVLCGRLRQVWGQLQTLSYSTAESRIRAGILQLARRYGLSDARGILINVKITHHELAAMVGTSRETVTRTLTGLQKQGIVQLAERRIIVVDPKRLAPIS